MFGSQKFQQLCGIAASCVLLDHFACEAHDLEMRGKRIVQRAVARVSTGDLLIAVDVKMLQDFSHEVGIVLGNDFTLISRLV